MQASKTGVFLNVPFDRSYEPLFLALIAALTSLGRQPRCAVEIPESGQTRLTRIVGLMQKCPVSFHDLCRVGTPARFNMPFELGLAYSIRKHRLTTTRHRFVILEEKAHRLSRTLSDVSGHDPHIHNGRPVEMIACVLDVLGTTRATPVTAKGVERNLRKLTEVAKRLKAAEGRDSVYFAKIFRDLVAAAAVLARTSGFIP